jgi:hypothetical protein
MSAPTICSSEAAHLVLKELAEQIGKTLLNYPPLPCMFTVSLPYDRAWFLTLTLS